MNKAERECWLKIRRALLEMVDAVEEFNEMKPRTAELRELRKKLKYGIIRLENPQDK